MKVFKNNYIFKLFILVLLSTEAMPSLLNPLPIQPTMRTKPSTIKYTKKTTSFIRTTMIPTVTTTTTTMLRPIIEDIPTETTPFFTTSEPSTSTMRLTTSSITTFRSTRGTSTSTVPTISTTKEQRKTTSFKTTQKTQNPTEPTITTMFSNEIIRDTTPRSSTSYSIKISTASSEENQTSANRITSDSIINTSTSTQISHETTDFNSEDLDCFKLMTKIGKKIFKTISVCNKELIVQYPCKTERAEKILCATKCLLKKLDMLDKQDYLTFESYKKFVINTVPKPLIEIGMIYAEPCIEEFGPKIDPQSETCASYAHFMKCIQDSMGELTEICDGR